MFVRLLLMMVLIVVGDNLAAQSGAPFKSQSDPAAQPQPTQTDEQATESAPLDEPLEAEAKAQRAPSRRNEDVFKPSEEISEDQPVPFPVDI